jgi:hypothetical protein
LRAINTYNFSQFLYATNVIKNGCGCGACRSWLGYSAVWRYDVKRGATAVVWGWWQLRTGLAVAAAVIEVIEVIPKLEIAAHAK